MPKLVRCPPVSGSPEQLLQLLRGLDLERGQHVGVPVEGDGDGRVPPALLDDLRLGSLTEQECCAGVAQVVELDPLSPAFSSSGRK
jgi:hypothetical protein